MTCEPQACSLQGASGIRPQTQALNHPWSPRIALAEQRTWRLLGVQAGAVWDSSADTSTRRQLQLNTRQNADVLCCANVAPWGSLELGKAGVCLQVGSPTLRLIAWGGSQAGVQNLDTEES